MAKLIQKSNDQLLSALEDNLYLMSMTLRGLSTGDAVHLRTLATQLRNLVCMSSRMPGLLWRLCDELEVNDEVSIRYPVKIDVTNPLTKGLYISSALVRADGSGANAVPKINYSLKKHIQEHEAVFIDGEKVSHEHLIGRLANETGLAHEAHGISREIAKLNSVRIGNVQPYFSILYADACLTLEVGERVILHAISRGYNRRRPPSLPLSAKSLEHTRFTSTLDVPAIPTPKNEGTMLFVL